MALATTDYAGLATGQSVEILTLLTGALSGTGNELANALNGNDDGNYLIGLGGNDTLKGGIGTDRLNGGTGIDLMTGGKGNDGYDVDSVADKIVEAANGRQRPGLLDGSQLYAGGER